MGLKTPPVQGGLGWVHAAGTKTCGKLAENGKRAGGAGGGTEKKK